MKKVSILLSSIFVLAVLTAWAPNVLSYPNGSSCANCHSFRGTQHDLHTDMFSCSVCHVTTGDNPVVADSCANCHDPVPLQTRHVDNYGASCDSCHDIAPPPPPAETNCSDGIDNDNDGSIDCADPDCDGFVLPNSDTTCGLGACESTGNLECRNEGQFDTCQEGNPAAEGPFDDASCSDDIDNDCDGATDASDSDCIAPAETCDDGVDNNGNGLVDCADPQCDGFGFNDITTCGVGACASTGSTICQNNGAVDTCDPLTPGAEGPFGDASCSDNIDNDCDGTTDANDSDCAAPPEVCDDGVDNNGNGLVDCADPQCDGFDFNDVTTCGVGACQSTGSTVCQNLGAVDTCQPGTPGDEGPYGDASCSDNIDNDCNNQTDDADSSCQPGPEICDNNIDDNGDGLVDCADPQCDGFVGQPGSCTTSLPGICSAGTLSCDLGETFCDQDNQAATEGPYTSPNCNDGLDNDCDGSADAGDSDCDAPPAVCGNQIVESGEQCDDGNQVNGDGCENDCTLTPAPEPFCGDGNVDVGEQCDDGNNVSGDGCEADCTLPQSGGCSDGSLLVIREMEFDREDGELHIKGRATVGSTLTVIDSDTGAVLADGITVREGRWEAEIDDISSSLENFTVISSSGCAVDRDVETDKEYHSDDEHHHRRSSDTNYERDYRSRRESRHNRYHD